MVLCCERRQDMGVHVDAAAAHGPQDKVGLGCVMQNTEVVIILRNCKVCLTQVAQCDVI
jgi:hypothetical protein